KNVSTATLTSELLKLGFSNTFMHGVKPIQGNTQIVGEAFTLRYIPSREDFDYKIEYDNKTNKQRIAIEAIAPGEVLVIDARGETNAGTLGDILSTRLQYKGVSGLVTRSEEHTSELQSRFDLVCRLLLENNKTFK